MLDEVENEMLKYGNKVLLEKLHILFNKILMGKKIPEQWRECIILPPLRN